MTATTARLDAIEWRRDIDGCPAHTDCLRADVAYLLTLARKQAAALEAVGKVAARLEARAALNTRVSATGIYDDAMQLAADAASSIALVTAADLRAALGDGDE